MSSIKASHVIQRMITLTCFELMVFGMTHSMNQYLVINLIFCEKNAVSMLGAMLERFTRLSDQRWITLKFKALSNAGSWHLTVFHSLAS